ncbi:hypothetical protein JOC94_003208 [Bacillus thermophilus]|uniref:Uncharacterized protein n=1 Tax=Siminovitchia thermophila TaxID=1245522 RepID=A0ABS2R969_9BACI|nr:hypothetical protein [Siminovitchia thermophila]
MNYDRGMMELETIGRFLQKLGRARTTCSLRLSKGS